MPSPIAWIPRVSSRDSAAITPAPPKPMPPDPCSAPEPLLGIDQASDVVVVGAGIAGLTAAALLARQGLQVDLLEAHHQSGGCAGTFRRGA